MPPFLNHNVEARQRATQRATALGINREQIEEGLDALFEGSLLALAISGKIASGKDTVGSAVMNQISVNPVQHALAKALKDDLTLILNVAYSSPKELKRFISSLTAVDENTQAKAASLALSAVEKGPLDAYVRTPEVRRLTVFWAVDVKRKEDPEHWISQASKSIFSDLSQGKDVFLTDVRHVNEADTFRVLLPHLVRIDVSAEVQRQRLMLRDGLEPDPLMLKAGSETDLDNYQGFSLRLANNDTLEAAVETISEHLRTAPLYAKSK